MTGNAPTEGERDAAAWYGRLQRPEVDQPTLDAFRAWRADPRNDQAFRSIEAVWRTAGDLGADPHIGAGVAGALRRKGQVRRAAGLGAGLAAIAACGVLWLVAEHSEQRFTTGVGQISTLHLQDGSTVQIDTDSKLGVRWTRGERRVRLDRGQALFEVAHDATRRFVVSAGATEVEATGTRFDVRREPQAVAVVLLEGAVKVSRGGGSTSSWRLSPGQALTVQPEHAAPSRPDVARVTAWTRGELVFRDTPLDQVIAEANRYSARPLLLGEASNLGGVRVAGVFKQGDIDALAGALAELYDIRSERRSDGAVVLQTRVGARSGDRR